MSLPTETLAVLWLGAGAVVVWMLLPAVLNALGLTFRQSHIEEDPAGLNPLGDDDEYEELFAQLRGLGFESIGKRTTTCWFFLHHWYRTFSARIFAAGEGDTIALTYKLRAWDSWRLCFVTAFSDGAIVETANQMANFRIDEPDHFRWGLATPDRALLLERHRATCQEFAAKGSRSVAVLPVEQMNQLIIHRQAQSHRKHHRWTGLNSMSNSLRFLCVGLILVRAIAGPAPYLLPVSIMAWGLLWPALHAHLFRVSAGQSRAADARSREKQPAG